MVNYEIALILRSVAKRSDAVASLKRICTSIIQDHGAIIKKIESLGETKLPYKISAHKERFQIGRHVILDVEAPPTSAQPLRLKLSSDHDILRATILKLTHKLNDPNTTTEQIVNN